MLSCLSTMLQLLDTEQLTFLLHILIHKHIHMHIELSVYKMGKCEV